MPKAQKKRYVVLATVIMLVLAGCFSWPVFKAHVQAARCSDQMHVILYSSVFEWSAEHHGYLPDSLLSLSNDLIIPGILVCPSDVMRRPAANWSVIATNNCSYELVTTNLQEGNPNQVFIRCPIHGYVGYADDRLVDANGKLIKPNRMW